MKKSTLIPILVAAFALLAAPVAEAKGKKGGAKPHASKPFKPAKSKG